RSGRSLGRGASCAFRESRRRQQSPNQKLTEDTTMTTKKIVRAWKDEAYRKSLSEAERAMLPENPAGIIELTDGQLDVAGGAVPSYPCTISCTWDSKCPSKLCSLGYCPR